MGKITTYLLQIYLSSLTIRERLAFLDRVEQIYKDDGLKNQIALWKLQVGETSNLFFNKRLEWSHINENDLPKLLCPIKKFNNRGFEFPEWIFAVAKFQKSKKILDNFCEIDNKIPFQDILYPFVNYFCSQIKNIPDEFSSNAINDLKLGMLKYLSKISAQSLLEAMRNSGLKYQKFIQSTIDDDYTHFFTKYPYLVRLIFVRGQFWIDNNFQLFSTFENDKHLIFEKLNRSSINILRIKTDLSESHNYGKNVVILETDHNQFVFKQRNVDAENKFFSFLKHLNNNLIIKQYIPWLIKGNGYGWMEYIKQQQCMNSTEVKSFYTRMGSQLCLHYIFGSTDLHSENLIAHGEFPVFIDVETLLNPLINLNNKHLNNLNEYIDFKFGLSVSRAGILPQWMLGPDTNVYNNSSLGGSKEGLIYPSIIWENINTNQMSYNYVELAPIEDRNLVYLKSQLQDPANYTNDIVEGFTQTYKYFLENSYTAELLEDLQEFKDTSVRFVFRATKVYTFLLEYLYHPDYMKSGVARSIEMDLLAKGLLVDLSKRYIFWGMLNDELYQLENNDIPYYVANTSTKSLSSIHQDLYEDAFQFKSYERLLNLLNSLDTEDLFFQSQIIKNSVETKSKGDEAKEFQEYNNKSVLAPSILDIEKTLFDIGNKILESQIIVDSRSTWVSYVSNIVSHTYGYKPIGLDIANGNMGVAIFIGSLYLYSGDKLYKDVLKIIIQPILDILSEDWSKQEFLFRFGTGGTTGIASIIYGFTKLYEYTNEHKYLEYANKFLEIVTTNAIHKSLRQDVTSGNAGLLLVLTKLSEFGVNQNISSLMSECYRTIVLSGYTGDVFQNWDYQQNKKLLGFSHGSSGILYALSRYLPYRQSSENVEKVIGDILVYEDDLFDAKKLNWPDYRFETPDLEIASWCHGATGIGMSRLQLFKDNLFLRKSERDIQRAINKTVHTGAHFLDTLCCGNSGRIDFLLELQNTKFYDNKYKNYLNWLIDGLLSRYKVNGDFRYFSKFSTEDINVGFYQGISGIGYELLRTIIPVKFDSMLLFL